MIDASVNVSGAKKRFTDEDIVGHAITFVVGGSDSTASSLTFTSYLLALNPHVQERLQQEIDAYCEENPVIGMK